MAAFFGIPFIPGSSSSGTFPSPFRIYLVANSAIPAKGVPFFVPFWDLWAGRGGIWEQTVNPWFTIPILPL